MLVATLLLSVLVLAGQQFPVPYLIASPGISMDTLGEQDGESIIQVDGRENFEHDEADLSMVTVQYSGGPGQQVSLLAAIGAWLRPSQAVLPEEAVFPPGSTVEEVTESQSLQMDSSQRLAVGAALDQLDIDYDEFPLVAEVLPDMPATDELEPGDVVTAVDGTEVGTQAEVVELVTDREPGQSVDLTVLRDEDEVDSVDEVDVSAGEQIELTVDTVAPDEGANSEPDGGQDPETDDVEDTEPGAQVGILVESKMDFPFEVDISVGDIGGPSAGMMFSLGIMNRLSEEDLTGGHSIAGSGTVQPVVADEDNPQEREWEVGAVSGVAQKMLSAERQGAEYFFVAEGSCPQTEESAAEEIRVVPVETMSGAMSALESIRAGDDPDSLPRCSG